MMTTDGFLLNNPMRALSTVAQLAGTSRVLKGFNDKLSRECLEIAREVYAQTEATGWLEALKIQAAVELYLTTGEAQYLDFVLAHQEMIVKGISRTGWFTARLVQQLSGKKDKRSRAFVAAFREALLGYRADLEKRAAETPYGVPYRPSIWGAGWDIQRFGFSIISSPQSIPTSSLLPQSTMRLISCLDVILAAIVPLLLQV